MSAAFQPIVQKFGFAKFNIGTGAPSSPTQYSGFLVDSDGAIFAASSPTITHYWQGLPFDTNGRVAVEFAAVTSVDQNLGFTANGYVALGSGAIDRAEGGLAFSADGTLGLNNPVMGIASLQSYYDPSDISSLFQDLSGTIPVTASGQPVGLMLDLSGVGAHLSQSVALSRPTYTDDANGKYLLFDGGDYLTASSSEGAFKYLHDGSGGEFISGIERTGTTGFIWNNSSTSSQVGFRQVFNDTTIIENCFFDMGKGGSPYIIATTKSPANSFPVGTARVLGMTFGQSEGYDCWQDGVSVVSTASVGTASTANSQDNMRLGAAASGASSPMVSRYYGTAFFDEILSAGNRATVNQYWAGKMGISI